MNRIRLVTLITLSIAAATVAFSQEKPAGHPREKSLRSATVKNTETVIGAPANGNLANVPNDPEIGEILSVANEIDIQNAKLAKKKTQNPDVKKFAQEMIDDHGKAEHQLDSVYRKLTMRKTDTETSRGLESNANQMRKELSRKSGAEFDRAYIDAEVATHENVLKTIDTDLMPNAKTEEVRKLLQDTRAVISEHYEHAKRLKASLEPGSKKM